MIYTIITSKSTENVIKKWKKSNPKLFKKYCSNLLQILNLLYMKNFYSMYLPYTEKLVSNLLTN